MIMSDNRQIQHSETGTYRIEELLPPEVLDLTLEQVLTLLVQHIVRKPETVKIHIANTARIKAIEFSIHPSDMAQLLGSKGYTVYAFRTIAKAILGPLVRRYRYTVSVTHDQDDHDL